MPDTIDDLARRWKAQPGPGEALLLCEALLRSSPADWRSLVDEVGKHATDKHGANGQVLLAVARLYTAIDRLPDAQAALVSAGRAAPRDGAVYLLLGEVLLRRGDAERAEKVLVRAKQLGADDAETSKWMERAVVFKPVQAKAGARAVAVEVKNTAVHPLTPHPGMLPPLPPLPPARPLPPVRPPAISVDQDGITAIRRAPIAVIEEEALAAAGADLATTTQGTVADFADYAPEPPPAKSPFLSKPTGPMSPSTDTEVATFARPAATLADATQVSALAEQAKASREIDPAPVKESPPKKERAAPAEAPPSSVANPFKAASAPGSIRATMPAAKDVLDALANAGVFEPREASAGPIQWDRPNEKVRRRTAVGLSIGLVVFVLGSVGVLAEVNRRRARAHEEAEIALAKVEADLDSSKASLLPGIEQSIGHAFELDSRSPRAAMDWLNERAIKGLLTGGGEIAFEDAVGRAVEVKVPEEKFAFARVAAFLFQGDTGGAAALMPKWDGPAANEPIYQVITGAVLEHAGDPHAAERYQAAFKLAPNLVVTEMLLARATAFDGDPNKAADLAKQFRAKHPDRTEGSTLVALAWARDPFRGEQAPPEVADMLAHTGDLPLPLLAVPYGLQAMAAIDKKAMPDAKAAIEKGLGVANDPGMATWFGQLALETHDEPLVRKAALLAVTFSAVYAPARVLAARIALLGGRLDEALKATEDLDPTSPDVAIVRAAVGYERADADAMGRALEATTADAKKLPVFAALNLAPDILLGRAGTVWLAADAPTKVLDISHDDAPWSDLVAMDAALDLGLIDVADAIQTEWKGTEEKPLKAVRLSRLARYENRLDDADRYSKLAMENATVTPRTLIERILTLVAKNRVSDVGPLLARYPLVLGPASSWLSAYALASTGKLDEARGRTAQLDVPPALSPLSFRVMAAMSLAAMKDKKRAEPAVKALLAAGNADPDLLAAAASIGIKAPAPAKKPKKK